MKVVIGGATGLLGSELVRQSLRMPTVTSVVALGRRPVDVPQGADPSKLKNVVVEDFGNFSEEVRKEFEGANACIWTIGLTPTKAKDMDPEMVKRICQTYAVDSLRTFADSSPGQPFRYLYVSGMLAVRDQTQKPAFAPEYSLMRGHTETLVLKAGEEAAVEVGIARPGVILEPGVSLQSISAALGLEMSELNSVGLEHCAAAMLNQALNGFDKETLENADLRTIGEKAFSELGNSA